jgi:hypothetical protein
MRIELKYREVGTHQCPVIKLIYVKVMVFNATFIDISAISWWLVLLVEETGVEKAEIKIKNGQSEKLAT